MTPAATSGSIAADPMNTPGLLLSPDLTKGFSFAIMDVARTDADHVIELHAPPAVPAAYSPRPRGQPGHPVSQGGSVAN